MRRAAGLSGLIAVTMCAIGCATPAPLFRLDPRSTRAISWVAGRAVLEKELAGVRVVTSFEVQDGDFLALRIDVQNATGVPIDISPTDFSYMTCREADNGSCDGSYAVVDPEAMIADLDARQSRERADARNRQTFDTVLLLLSATADVATIASGHGHSMTGVNTANIAEMSEIDAARDHASLTGLASDRATWANLAFRRTTVEPGRTAGGLVYIPIDPGARYVWVHVRAGGQIFGFGFTQTRREVPRSG